MPSSTPETPTKDEQKKRDVERRAFARRCLEIGWNLRDDADRQGFKGDKAAVLDQWALEMAYGDQVDAALERRGADVE